MNAISRAPRAGLLYVVSAIFLTSFPRLLSAADMDFFPLTEGSQWVYETTNKAKKDSFDMKVLIEGPWKDEGRSGTIMTQRDKRGRMREFLLSTDKGIFIQKLGLSKALTPEVFSRFTPAVPRVIFPLTPGTTVQWEGRLKVAWVDKPIWFEGRVVGWEDIEVPAGKFRCIKLFYDQKRGEERVQETAWYAEDVGQVKYDGGEFVKELKSYRIGAPEHRSTGDDTNPK